MKVSQFMREALFNPRDGYYRTKNPIGKNSDFITAPEISQTFGETIALYLLEVFYNKNEKISLVEMGAGRGVLMFDILSTIKKLAEKNNQQALDFLAATEFHIIEISEALTKIQQEKLRDFKIIWHRDFKDFEKVAQKIFFISNELFDCFPIDQYVLTEQGWRERIVVEENFTLAPFDKKIHQFVENEIGTLAPIGGVFEYSADARNFMTQLCEALKRNGGIAINFDYGYFKHDFANTLQSLKHHEPVSVFTPDCDITARVDFAALDKITKSYNLNSSLITQSEFLISLGIKDRQKILIENNPQLSQEIASAIERLIDCTQMGELFKCHIIWK